MGCRIIVVDEKMKRKIYKNEEPYVELVHEVLESLTSNSIVAGQVEALTHLLGSVAACTVCRHRQDDMGAEGRTDHILALLRLRDFLQMIVGYIR